MFSGEELRSIAKFRTNWSLVDTEAKLSLLGFKFVYYWQSRTSCFSEEVFLKTHKKVPEASWTSNGSYKTIFWWVKCKWIRNMWIKFPLKYTGALKLGEKMFGKTWPDFYRTQNLWIRFGDSGPTQFSDTSTLTGNAMDLKASSSLPFPSLPTSQETFLEQGLFFICRSGYTTAYDTSHLLHPRYSSCSPAPDSRPPPPMAVQRCQAERWTPDTCIFCWWKSLTTSETGSKIDVLPDRKGYYPGEPKATWTWRHQKVSSILLQDYFSVGRECTFFRNVNSQHSAFRLVPYSLAKNVSSRPKVLSAQCLCPPAKQRKGWLRQPSMPTATWVGSWVLWDPQQVGVCAGLQCWFVFPGELCKWKSDHCQAAWKDSFPWSNAMISGLSPTHHFPTSRPSPLLSPRACSAPVCRGETRKCKHAALSSSNTGLREGCLMVVSRRICCNLWKLVPTDAYFSSRSTEYL